MTTRRDPLDEGRPGLKEWHEFQATFSVSLLLAWIVSDINDLALGWYDDLQERLDSGFDIADGLNEDDPDRAAAVPIRGPYDDDYQAIIWWPREDAERLYDQLFPRGSSRDDHLLGWRGLVLIGLHSALESYCRGCGLQGKRTPLPLAVKEFLAHGAPLDADTYISLVDLDETRHLFVHKRGVVDEGFVAAVPYTRLMVGERRPLSDQDVQRFTDAVWHAAIAIRD